MGQSDLMQYITKSKRWIGTTELMRLSGQAKGSVGRCVRALVKHGFLVQRRVRSRRGGWKYEYNIVGRRRGLS